MIRQWTKISVAAFYAIGGPLIHLMFITQQPQVYTAIDDNASAFYALMWNILVLPNLVSFVALLIVLEAMAGLSMFSHNPRLAQIGQMSGFLFNLALVPFWFAYGVPNLLLAALHLWLFIEEAREEHASRPRLVIDHK